MPSPPRTDDSSHVRVERGEKRVRVYLGGELVADTARPRLVWEVPYYPTYYLPLDDARVELLERTDHASRSPSLGQAIHYDVRGGERVAPNAARVYVDSPVWELRDLVRFDWNAMDRWLEEEEEVFVHPRDPYTRVEVLDSSRHVRVEIDGVTVAESTQPRILFETGLPPRFYLPVADVRTDLLTPTEKRTACPYKGEARYWSVRVGDELHADVAWCYPAPLPESQRIAGLVCFYNERVDLFVDDEHLERPNTKFS